MKDTKIPLSIAFIDEFGRIISIQEMEPMQQTKRYNSPGAASCALEVNQRWFEKNGIDSGDTVELNIPITLTICLKFFETLWVAGLGFDPNIGKISLTTTLDYSYLD